MSPKQARFVEEYLLDANGSQAAIRAGYSPKTAGIQAAQLLANSEIAAAIDARKLERSEQLGIDAMWVLKRLTEEAEADLADLYDRETGALKPVHEWPEIWRQGLVAGVEVEELFEGRGEDREHIGVIRKVRLSDRVRRLELIGKHVLVSAFQEVIRHQGLDGLAERLARANARHHEAQQPTSALSTPMPEPVPHALHERLRRATQNESRVPNIKREPTRTTSAKNRADEGCR